LFVNHSHSNNIVPCFVDMLIIINLCLTSNTKLSERLVNPSKTKMEWFIFRLTSTFGVPHIQSTEEKQNNRSDKKKIVWNVHTIRPFRSYHHLRLHMWGCPSQVMWHRQKRPTRVPFPSKVTTDISIAYLFCHVPFEMNNHLSVNRIITHVV